MPPLKQMMLVWFGQLLTSTHWPLATRLARATRDFLVRVAGVNATTNWIDAIQINYNEVEFAAKTA
jgi:hypothetical protein